MHACSPTRDLTGWLMFIGRLELNSIGDAGAIELGEGLKTNTVLQRLQYVGGEDRILECHHTYSDVLALSL